MTKLKVYNSFTPLIFRVTTLIGLPLIYILTMIILFNPKFIELAPIICSLTMGGLILYVTVFDTYSFGGMFSSKGDGAPILILSSKKGVSLMRSLFEMDMFFKTLSLLIPTVIFMITVKWQVAYCLYMFLLAVVLMLPSLMITRHFDNMIVGFVVAYIEVLGFAIGMVLFEYILSTNSRNITITFLILIIAVIVEAVLGLFLVNRRLKEAYNA